MFLFLPAVVLGSLVLCGFKAIIVWKAARSRVFIGPRAPQARNAVLARTATPFKLRFACLSEAVFEPGVRIEAEHVPGPFGPLRFVFFTQYSEAGQLAIPIVIEAEGLSLDRGTATESFADLIRVFLRFFAVAANAPVHELYTFDDLPPLQANRERRLLSFKMTNSLLSTAYGCPARICVSKAAQEYELALRNYGPARQTPVLAHLFRACLILKQGLIAHLCSVYQCGVDQLPSRLRVAPDELDGYVSRELIFSGRNDLFHTAYDANARFSSLQHPEETALWEKKAIAEEAVHEIAAAVRNTIFQLAEVDQDLLVKLNALPFRSPFLLASGHIRLQQPPDTNPRHQCNSAISLPADLPPARMGNLR